MIPKRRSHFQQLMRDFSEMAPYNVVHLFRTEEPLNRRRWEAAARESLRRQFPGYAIAVDSLEGDVEEAVRRLMNQPLQATDLPLRAWSLEDPAGEVWVGLAVDHWLMDDFSIRRFLHQVQESYLRGGAGPSPLAWRNPAESRCGVLGTGWLLSKLGEHRRAVRLPLRNPLDFTVDVMRANPGPETLGRVLAWGRGRGMTANDVFLAAAARALGTQAGEAPVRPDASFGLAVPVDLRRFESGPEATAPGFALGYFSLVADGLNRDLEEAARRIAAETRTWRGHRERCLAPLAPARAMWLFTRKNTSRATLFRRGLRLSLALSNVNLTGSWVEAGPSRVAEYRRFGPAGPLVPLVFEVTTLHDRLSLDVTYRTTAFDRSEVEAIASAWVRELDELGREAVPVPGIAA